MTKIELTKSDLTEDEVAVGMNEGWRRNQGLEPQPLPFERLEGKVDADAQAKIEGTVHKLPPGYHLKHQPFPDAPINIKGTVQELPTFLGKETVELISTEGFEPRELITDYFARPE